MHADRNPLTLRPEDEQRIAQHVELCEERLRVRLTLAHAIETGEPDVFGREELWIRHYELKRLAAEEHEQHKARFAAYSPLLAALSAEDDLEAERQQKLHSRRLALLRSLQEAPDDVAGRKPLWEEYAYLVERVDEARERIEDAVVELFPNLPYTIASPDEVSRWDYQSPAGEHVGRLPD